MFNISYESATTDVDRRLEGFRRAEKSGLVFEKKPRRKFRWPWTSEQRELPVTHYTPRAGAQ